MKLVPSSLPKKKKRGPLTRTLLNRAGRTPSKEYSELDLAGVEDLRALFWHGARANAGGDFIAAVGRCRTLAVAIREAGKDHPRFPSAEVDLVLADRLYELNAAASRTEENLKAMLDSLQAIQDETRRDEAVAEEALGGKMVCQHCGHFGHLAELCILKKAA